MAVERFYSIGYAAHLLGCEPDELVRMIRDGRIEADADLTGDVLIIEEEQVGRAKDALRAQRRQVEVSE